MECYTWLPPVKVVHGGGGGGGGGAIFLDLFPPQIAHVQCHALQIAHVQCHALLRGKWRRQPVFRRHKYQVNDHEWDGLKTSTAVSSGYLLSFQLFMSNKITPYN